MTYDIETVVRQRYEEGARQPEEALCCPTTYEEEYLSILPPEIIAKDYGCGNPTLYVSSGETVVDLGSGAGKNCYIIAQKVGASGRVIGVDFNDEMLNLSRSYQEEMTRKLGYHNTEFVKAKIQDLKLDLDKVQRYLEKQPITSIEHLSSFNTYCDFLRCEKPLIPDKSVDVVISNCVLNLVQPRDKQQLFEEIYRVLKRGGRAVISDIVCDETPGDNIINDPDLWSGCIAGAFREDELLEMFEKVGFYGIEILQRQDAPWQVIEGIEFRAITIRAYKGKEGECLERNQAVIYRGPWKKVEDDDGHTYYRGQRMAVCDKTYNLLTGSGSPYKDDLIPVPPYQEIPIESAAQFSCRGASIRHPGETKGSDYKVTLTNSDSVCCAPENNSPCC